VGKVKEQGERRPKSEGESKTKERELAEKETAVSQPETGWERRAPRGSPSMG
jgi:hypothetical protein